MYSGEGRRSWPSIVVDILEVTATPSNKMRIMYKSNLNFERFTRYFDDMLRKGFVEEMNGNNGRSLYKTTERGRTLLRALHDAIELIASDDS
jgi:predicted transcriptional regulator